MASPWFWFGGDLREVRLWRGYIAQWLKERTFGAVVQRAVAERDGPLVYVLIWWELHPDYAKWRVHLVNRGFVKAPETHAETPAQVETWLQKQKLRGWAVPAAHEHSEVLREAWERAHLAVRVGAPAGGAPHAD